MFYEFHQNNSGGNFRGPAIMVIVEADSADEANRRAENLGLYWYGADHDGPDCPCCGDRWYQAWNDDGDEEPTVYGKPIEEFKNEDKFWTGFSTDRIPYALISYLDGTIKTL